MAAVHTTTFALLLGVQVAMAGFTPSRRAVAEELGLDDGTPHASAFMDLTATQDKTSAALKAALQAERRKENSKTKEVPFNAKAPRAGRGLPAVMSSLQTSIAEGAKNEKKSASAATKLSHGEALPMASSKAPLVTSATKAAMHEPAGAAPLNALAPESLQEMQKNALSSHDTMMGAMQLAAESTVKQAVGGALASLRLRTMKDFDRLASEQTKAVEKAHAGHQ